MNKKIQYLNYCVAYLDILGFKNIVNTEDASTIHEIFSNVRLAKKLISGGKAKSDALDRVRGKTKFYLFSDSIVCAIPFEEPMALELVSSNCMLLQHALWSKGIQVWIRGGIAIGGLYCGQSEVFGPALVEAYMLESTMAKYPRIIMTEQTYQQGIENTNDKMDIPFIFQTDSGLKMVESFKYFNTFEPSFSCFIASVEKAILEETDHHIREKYIWIKDKYGHLFNYSKKANKD